MVFSAFGLQKYVFGLVCFSFIVCGTYVCSCTWMQTLTCRTMWSQMAACRASPHLFPLRQVSFKMGSLVYYCISQALHFLGIPPLCLTSPCRTYNVGSLKLQIQLTTCGCRWVLRVQAQVLRGCHKHCTHRVTSQLCCIETELCNSSGLWRGTREVQNTGQQENIRGWRILSIMREGLLTCSCSVLRCAQIKCTRVVCSCQL